MFYRDGQRTWLRDDRRRMLQHLRRWCRHVLLGRHHVRGSGGGVRLHAAARGDVRCGRVAAGRRKWRQRMAPGTTGVRYSKRGGGGDGDDNENDNDDDNNENAPLSSCHLWGDRRKIRTASTAVAVANVWQSVVVVVGFLPSRPMGVFSDRVSQNAAATHESWTIVLYNRYYYYP